MKENYNKGSKTQVFLFLSYFSLTAQKKLSSLASQYFLFFFLFVSNCCIPSDYFVKNKLIITNYYIIP